MTENATEPAMDGNDAVVRQIKVMISSTRADLEQYREIAAKELQRQSGIWKDRFSFMPIAMEMAVQTGKREYPVKISKDWVEESDWVILIVGYHYGTITDEEGAEGVSVTEWEYRHAEKMRKKIFVFLSGEDDTPEEYNAQGDTKVLSKWTKRQDEDQCKGLADFRKKLGGQHAAHFRNAKHFHDLLHSTLLRAVVDLPPDLSDLALRKLFETILDSSLRPCFRGVKQLHRSKEIHDAIHRLRQQALVRLRDTVDRKSKGEKTRGLQSTMDEARTVMAQIAEKTRQLKEDEETADLKRQVARLNEELDELRVRDDDDEPLPIQIISEQLDVCFSTLEKAFLAANVAMGTRKNLFRALHDSMTLELEKADKGKLSKSARAQIAAEIEKTKFNRDRLLGTLEDHDTWQAVHGEVIEASNSGKVAKQRKCLEREAPRLAASIERIRIQAMEDEEDISVLEGEFVKLAKAQVQLLAQMDDAPVGEQQQAWDDFCRVFDGCFFKVDERTLAIVGRSKARVEDTEASFKNAGIDKSGDT